MILVPQNKIDEYTSSGWWGTQTLWDLFAKHLREQPDAEAVVDAPNRADFAHGAPRRLSWAALTVEVDGFCLLLLEHGIQRDAVLVLQLPNCVEQFVAYLACARLGIVVTPVPVQYREHELGQVLSTTQATAVLTFSRIGKVDAGHQTAAMYSGLQASHPALKTVFAWGDGVPEGVVPAGVVRAPMSDVTRMQLADAERAAKVGANDVFTICWTSGTEAQPKGVPRSHNCRIPDDRKDVS